ncbi:MAG: hypothetical protein FWF59_13000 [Turicibacter sp.]|nr:hypothetical protein [Turicibacter sp.]
MNAPKRNYYRNWYQQWQEEKKLEEKDQAMKYFSEMGVMVGQGEGESQLYSRQGQIFQKVAGGYAEAGFGEPQGHYDNFNPGQFGQQGVEMDADELAYQNYRRQSQGSKKMLSKRQSRQLQDIGKGLLMGLPIVLLLLVILYAFDFIPQAAVNRFLMGDDPVVVATTQAHSQLMEDFNSFNQQIASHITGGTLSPETAAQLQGDYTLLQANVEAFIAQNEGQPSLTRPWSLKLQSLGQMMGAINAYQQVNNSVIDTYNQFVADQNDIGDELTRALSEVLTDNNIPFTQLPGGGISIR